MNKNVINIALGFAAGYFTRSIVSERQKTQEGHKNELSRIIMKSKEAYDAAAAHPERIPEAVDQARKVVVKGNDDG